MRHALVESLSTDRQKQLLRGLLVRIADRVAAEEAVESGHAARVEVEEQEFARAHGELVERYERETASIEEQTTLLREKAREQFRTRHSGVKGEFESVLNAIEYRFNSGMTAAKEEREYAHWEAAAVFDESKNLPKYEFDEFDSQLNETRAKLDAERQELAETLGQAVALLKKRRQWRDTPEPTVSLSQARDSLKAPSPGGGEGWGEGDSALRRPSPLPLSPRERENAFGQKETLRRFHDSIAAAAAQLQVLRHQRLGSVFVGWRLFWLFLVLWAFFCILVLAANLKGAGWLWIAYSGAAAMAGSIFAAVVLYPIARNQAEQVYRTLLEHAAQAEAAFERWLKFADEDHRRKQQECEERYAAVVIARDQKILRADEQWTGKRQELAREKQAELQAANEKYPAALEEIVARRDRQLQIAQDEYEQRLAALTERHQCALDLLNKEHARRLAELDERHQREWQVMADAWHSGVDYFRETTDEMNARCRRLFPEWAALLVEGRTPPTDVPPAIRLGQYEVNLERFEHGVPTDPRLVPERTNFALPALLPFPENPALLIKASGAGRVAAVETLQTTMLRMLTAIPPGKVRFTVIDPVGLGENFAAFMHLADYDELLISSRIWTEASHIEQRLTDLTEHMETVFQTYLRNEFATIEDYNASAGEVAEPYRILVVANFPANFTEEAARRLVSIATSGARCGVYTLISVDTQQKMPHNFNLSDLEGSATNLVWKTGRFVVVDSDLSKLPLMLDAPPAADEFGDIVRAAGHEARNARRVEVPFDRIAPSNGDLWSRDSRGGIDVPLGRAGATKLQHMRLGKGTSQHVMVAGKTGSGKSSFLHALITNVALHYNPDEIEFYLIDFKKGVEFKTYAAHSLPHARVIAIESDREFGVSVLQRLDGLLKERGDLFRRQGVQDLESFRDATLAKPVPPIAGATGSASAQRDSTLAKPVPPVPMPRVLLIIDEFQEFFVEDDRLAQTAALLLDRLIRQGRAFGIHVLLGSQTLSGAYSLARSTLGQVAVRIALQCSETDAHLILSEDNTAARLLTRPGEAIYNDANGLLEGNHPFQVAWLPDDTREGYLKQIQQCVRERNLTPAPPIVFEGNVPADPGRNHSLTRLLDRAVLEQAWASSAAPAAIEAWLGEPVEIKGPTSALFRRQSGMNLVLVGQSEEAALGIMCNCLVSLAAQCAPLENANGTSGNVGQTFLSAEPSPLPLSQGERGFETAATSRSAQFYIFDGSPADSPEAATWRRLAEVLPHRVQLVGRRDVTDAVAELAAELARREDDESGPPVFVLIYNLGRFRDLRRDEEDYGFGGFDKEKPPSPSQQLADVLRDGPAVGIHTILWCDTYNNLGRWFSPAALREMEMRLVFQMSATDSSNLIDSPAAGQLGSHRALLYLEEQGTLEKFRPYGPPSAEWFRTLENAFSTSEVVHQPTGRK